VGGQEDEEIEIFIMEEIRIYHSPWHMLLMVLECLVFVALSVGPVVADGGGAHRRNAAYHLQCQLDVGYERIVLQPKEYQKG